MYDDETVDTSKLRYVLYARKSRTDEFGQIRSIPDQVAECELFARRQQVPLKIVAVIKEEQSAKKPGQRKKFKDMLANIPKNMTPY
jgi:DNA invertase Pin-like site-specific DNA recombinase